MVRPNPDGKTTPVLVIPARIMPPLPGRDAALTDPAITGLIRPGRHAYALISAGLTNGVVPRPEWACGPGGSWRELTAPRSPDGNRHIVSCGISPARVHDNMICGK